MTKSIDILNLGIGIMILVIINQLVDKFPMRIDLTEEKRYSISDASKEVLNGLQEPVYIEVFLDGEMPAGFKRLQKSIRETLEQLDFYSKGKINYKFKDPSQAKSKKAQNEYFRSLIQKGLQPTNLNYTRDGSKTEKLIFPGALISYLGQEKPVLLLKGNQGTSSEEQLNQSIEGIEYELVSVIRNLSTTAKKNVGLVIGHQEPDSLNLAGLTGLLMDRFNVFTIDLPNRDKDLNTYDAIILPKPTTAFSEKEKYLLDQYMMNGGKGLFFLDALRVNMDSASGDGTFAFPYNLGLEDMLFKYGVRINQNFVQDVFSGDFPVVAGMTGNQPQIRMLPWPFFPNVNSFGDHPITKNLDVIQMKFVSTIDTVKATGILKTPLLATSDYSMISSAPVKVAFNELQKNLDPKRFNAGSQTVSYLLSGKFTSIYKNRILPKHVKKADFIADGKPGMLLVCADGDMIRNEFDLKTGEPLELGLNAYSKQKFANGDFVINALDFMLNTNGVITSKNKEIKIRPLDKVRIAKEKFMWQIINMVCPLILLTIFGFIRVYFRKRKYSNFR